VDVLIELPARPYLERIRESECTEEVEKALSEAEEGVILIPMLLNKDGSPRYVSLLKPDSLRGKIERFWARRDSSWGTKGHTVTPDMRVYQGKVNLVVKGERKGSPCSHCPKVLDSVGAESTCTFGVRECKSNLNLRELLHGN